MVFDGCGGGTGWADSVTRLETSEESTPGRDREREVGGSLEEEVVSTGGKTTAVLGTGRKTCEGDATGTLDSLTSDPEGLPGVGGLM